MSDKEQLVCDACRQRPATHHTCYAGSRPDTHLCTECFEQSASPIELESFRETTEAIRNGKCRWCGAQAVGGTGGLSIPGVIEARSDFWCEACRLDLVDFSTKPENQIPEFPFDDEAAQARVPQQLADYERRKAEFMRERIRQRS